MKFLLKILQYLFYFFTSIIFLNLTPHKLSIIYFIKDAIFCVGWVYLIDVLCDYIICKIEIYFINKHIKNHLINRIN